MNWLAVGGSMRRSACGSTMRRSAWLRDMPTERAASTWPRGMPSMPARKISDRNALGTQGEGECRGGKGREVGDVVDAGKVRDLRRQGLHQHGEGVVDPQQQHEGRDRAGEGDVAPYERPQDPALAHAEHGEDQADDHAEAEADAVSCSV